MSEKIAEAKLETLGVILAEELGMDKDTVRVGKGDNTVLITEPGMTPSQINILIKDFLNPIAERMKLTEESFKFSVRNNSLAVTINDPDAFVSMVNEMVNKNGRYKNNQVIEDIKSGKTPVLPGQPVSENDSERSHASVITSLPADKLQIFADRFQFNYP